MALGSHVSESFLAYQLHSVEKMSGWRVIWNMESDNLNLIWPWGSKGGLKKDVFKQTIAIFDLNHCSLNIECR